MYKVFVFVFSFILIISCSNRINNETEVVGDVEGLPLFNTCYAINPIDIGSTKTQIEVEYESLKDDDLVKLATLLNGKQSRFDSIMAYVTSFKFQKRIAVASDCLDKLTTPRRSFIMEIYYNSVFTTSINAGDLIFRELKEVNIYDYGKCNLYIYELTGPPSQQPKYVYILLNMNDDNEWGLDYDGFTFCGNGLKDQCQKLGTI